MYSLVRSVVAAGCLVLFCSFSGRAEESPGDAILKQMDDSLTRAKDVSLLFDMIIPSAGAEPRVLQMRVTTKGRQWRRADFLAPGDVKGMRFLVLDVSQMYVFVPAQRKVRRVASHIQSMGFMGSTISHDDMAIATYGNLYSAEVTSEDDKTWTLLATRRPGQEFPYLRIVFTIRKDLKLPVEIRYFNEKGVLTKTETRTDYVCERDICLWQSMSMVDHTRDRRSEIRLKEWKVNSGVPDEFFTVRSLELGR